MFDRGISERKFRYIGPSHPFYEFGSVYLIVVTKNIIGSVKVKCLHGYEQQPYANSQMHYINELAFLKHWRPAYSVRRPS